MLNNLLLPSYTNNKDYESDITFPALSTVLRRWSVVKNSG